MEAVIGKVITNLDSHHGRYEENPETQRISQVHLERRKPFEKKRIDRTC